MIDGLEPLSETPLGKLGKLRKWHRPKSSRGMLVLISDVFTSVTSQRSIYGMCKNLLASGLFQAVFVEGDNGPLDPELHLGLGQDLEERVRRHSQVSPGVLQILEEDRRIPVFGIDDMELRERHQRLSASCRKSRPEWMALARRFRGLFERIKSGMGLSPQWLEPFEVIYESQDRLPLGERVRRLARFAGAAGLALEGYPSILRFLGALDMEEKLDFQKIEAEREAMVSQLGRVFESGRIDTGECESALPSRLLSLLEAWREGIGMDDGDLEAEIGRYGLEAVSERARLWLFERLRLLSMRTRAGSASISDLYRQVISLAQRMGFDVFRFPGLMRYIEYTELASEIPPDALGQEIDRFGSELMRELRTSPQQEAIEDIQKHLSILEKAGSLEFTPDSAVLIKDCNTWSSLQAKLRKLEPKADEIPIPPGLDEVARNAVQYSRISAKRSRLLAEESVQRFGAEGLSGAIVVCGGFHMEGMTRVLRNGYPDLAWSSISPAVDLEEIKDENA